MTERAAVALRAEFGRKALHLATALLPVSLAYGWSTQDRLRLLLAGATAVALMVEALRRYSRPAGALFDRLVGSMLRRHERRALTGATWLALAMALVLWWAPRDAAVAALWAAAVGDAAAALVGRSVTRWRGGTPGHKTLVGSMAAGLATALGVYWLTPATPLLAFGIGAVAALAERPALPVDDNLRIALAVALAATLVGLR